MGQTLQIRLFDTPLLEFETTDGDADDDGILDIRDVVTLGDAALLPHGLEPTPEGVYKWLSTRALPSNRRYADKLCVAMGIRPGDVERIVNVGLGLGLNDSYWVVPAGFDGKFRDFNLFENGFSEALAAVAFTGVVDTSAIPQRGLTPELTTNGTLRKAWRISGGDGRRLLYKGSSDGCRPGEWLSECLASQVADAMGVRHAPYWPDVWPGSGHSFPADALAGMCSVCACFCTVDVSYVPFATLTGKASMASCVRQGFALGDEAFEDFCDMVVFDALVCNTDRHFTNFGYLVEAASNRVLGAAPVFDNGRALFPNYGDAEVADAALLAGYTRPAFGPPSFEELAGRVMGARQRDALLRVAQGFELVDPVRDGSGGGARLLSRGLGSSSDPDSGLGSDSGLDFRRRCETLSAFLKQRAARLADLPLVDRDELREMESQTARA